MFPREMYAPEHISLVISVPRQQTVRARAYDIDSERWVEKVLHSVFLHPSISRMEENQYQAFFRYVSTKEYPAAVDMCL